MEMDTSTHASASEPPPDAPDRAARQSANAAPVDPGAEGRPARKRRRLSAGGSDARRLRSPATPSFSAADDSGVLAQARATDAAEIKARADSLWAAAFCLKHSRLVRAEAEALRAALEEEEGEAEEEEAAAAASAAEESANTAKMRRRARGSAVRTARAAPSHRPLAPEPTEADAMEVDEVGAPETAPAAVAAEEVGAKVAAQQPADRISTLRSPRPSRTVADAVPAPVTAAPAPATAALNGHAPPLATSAACAAPTSATAAAMATATATANATATATANATTNATPGSHDASRSTRPVAGTRSSGGRAWNRSCHLCKRSAAELTRCHVASPEVCRYEQCCVLKCAVAHVLLLAGGLTALSACRNSELPMARSGARTARRRRWGRVPCAAEQCFVATLQHMMTHMWQQQSHSDAKRAP